MPPNCARLASITKGSRMQTNAKSLGIDRRQFLARTSGSLLAAAIPGSAKAAGRTGTSSGSSESSAGSSPQPAVSSMRKIPIGVFAPVYQHLSLEEMLERVSALGLEAMEIGTGGYPGTGHCPIDELLADPAKAKAWKKKFEDRGIPVSKLRCH